MERKTTPPAVQTFLICREIFQDQRTGEHILVGPSHEYLSPHFPATAELNVFVQVSSGHGSYRPELRLQDLEGQVAWAQALDPPFKASDPLKIITLTFHLHLSIPQPCKYEIVLLANEEEVGRRGFRGSRSDQPHWLRVAERLSLVKKARCGHATNGIEKWRDLSG